MAYFFRVVVVVAESAWPEVRADTAVPVATAPDATKKSRLLNLEFLLSLVKTTSFTWNGLRYADTITLKLTDV